MKHTQEEILQYIDIVDQVAIISKTDLQGNITFVNDIFCKVAKYSRKELIGQPHNIVRHSDMDSIAFAQLWETIQSGKPWAGQIKNKAKDGSAYHVNANVFPIHDKDGNIIEYMAVRFLITDNIEEQRKFKAQVRDKLMAEKKVQKDLKEQIKQLEMEIKNIKAQKDNTIYLSDQLENEKKSKKKLAQQVNSYENEIANMSSNLNTTIKQSKSKVEKAEMEARNALKKIEPLTLKIEKHDKTIETQSKQIATYEDSLKKQAKIIHDLRDVISSKEDDIKRLSISKKTT